VTRRLQEIHRVAVTGVGMLSPLGHNAGESWTSLLEGRAHLTEVEAGMGAVSRLQFAGLVPGFQSPEMVRRVDEALSYRDQRRLDRFILLGALAAEEAISQAGLQDLEMATRDRVGVIIGSGIGGLGHMMAAAADQHDARRPFYLPGVLINSCAGVIAARHRFTGAINAVSASCATGAYALGDALRRIRYGFNDVVICGGTEAAVLPAGYKAFMDLGALAVARGQEALSACRPWDKDRSGFILAEGAGILVFENYDHAVARGATVLAEVAGYGQSAGGEDLVAPQPGGRGAIQAIQRCLDDAGWSADSIDYINAHATGTPLGDDIELEAIEAVFSEAGSPVISSIKGLTGHTLGAAGAIEAIISVKTLTEGIAPGTHNFREPSRMSVIKRLKVPMRGVFRRVLSNSFGFGGVNACLAFEKA